ncbi:Pdl protein [Pseudomonas laurylsulfativorans]|uniref:Pdl protein n=1 Tax=Pseudomonas laurylsulfativorans TaxID=1943631 RepID=A0A2S3VWK0_9PSED|nr:lipase family protein [Pseudomonas laurylsulfativorans]POF44301.1 Pdl protein [Pseudomonas laurylsulfativorans]
MNDRLHRTDTLGSCKTVICGKQKMHWIEFQLLDEQGEPLANLPFRALNEATRSDFIPEYRGRTDAEGVIRLVGLLPLAINLLIDAELLAELLQNRRLRAQRAEPERPGFADRTPLYGPQRSGFSPIEQQAVAAGHGYHYLRIGQLCDRLPTFDPPLADARQPPAYHFPDPKFGGFTIGDDQLDRRHVLEVCPLRAWSLTLHHQAQYSLANAYNLGLMSILAYSLLPETERGSAEEFFLQQCLDLSRTPRVLDAGQNWPSLVTDVPFNQRYTLALMLDTQKADPPEGDTQLFYAISATQVLVAWRGTETNGIADLITDVTFRPTESKVAAYCEPKVPCGDLSPEGSVHMGFREAFEVATRSYRKDLGGTIPEKADDRKLFICGHSLGGALGMIHSASLKQHNPLLYTYGMPRTFTLKAIQSLSGLWHFRHVNDTDVVPRVPPEAALDNYLYDLYGTMGTVIGLSWSIGQSWLSSLFKHGDPYSHHGEVAMFFRTEQHQEQSIAPYPAYRNPQGQPYRSTISYKLQEMAKLYLVPSLSAAEEQQVEQAQKRLHASLDAASRARFFPPYSNPAVGRLLSIGDHFMSQYQPYIHNQLMESINPEREPLLERQVRRRKFEQQMKEYYGSIPADEYSRNSAFLELQKLIDRALQVTWQTEGGTEALQRFDAIADPMAFYEKTFG